MNMMMLRKASAGQKNNIIFEIKLDIKGKH